MKLLIKNVSDAIAGKAPLGVKRSSGWSAVRKRFLETNKTCAVCGGTSKLEVHHVQSFHEHTDLELDPNNLIVLCESGRFGLTCHLLMGHLGNYQDIYISVRTDAKTWLKKLSKRKKIN